MRPVFFQWKNATEVEIMPLGVDHFPWVTDKAPYPIEPGQEGLITVLQTDETAPPSFVLTYVSKMDPAQRAVFIVQLDTASQRAALSVSDLAKLSSFTIPAKGANGKMETEVVYLITFEMDPSKASPSR